MKTIYALSSGHGKAGLAVIRISGPDAGLVLSNLSGGIPHPRYATLRPLQHPVTHEVMDRALVIWFPAPRSYTGEDMAELHIHGGRAVIDAIFAALEHFEGFRYAEAGEFSRRAFENGKLDLTEVEGIADLIDAETDAQRRQALRQSSGALGVLYEGWRHRLIGALASIEAELDFSDEEDVPEDVATASQALVSSLQNEIASHLADRRRGEILRDGLHVVIAGPPNAGKSSLMNALAQRDVAIVSAEAGTTRDVIEVRLDLDGFPVILVDTAGIRETSTLIEQEGIRRALGRAKHADLVLWLHDGESNDRTIPVSIVNQVDTDLIEVLNKIDLFPEAGKVADGLAVSVKSGSGMDTLLAALGEKVRKAANIGESPAITRSRHRQELSRCCDALSRFLDGRFNELELRAEDLREAATALGRLTGRVDVEDILDKIFADFCIGK